MRLDRNVNKDHSGKYSLILMRVIKALREKHAGVLPAEVENALIVLHNIGALDSGDAQPGDQFFVIRYKDLFAIPAFQAYTAAVFREIQLKFNPRIAGKLMAGQSLTPEEEAQRIEAAAEIKSLNEYLNDLRTMCRDAETVKTSIPT